MSSEQTPTRYYFLNRPPGIGTHPAGETARESWLPRQNIPGTERPAFGWVEYPAPLAAGDVYSFELYPAGEVERARYRFWLYAGKDDEEAARMIAEWTAENADYLRELVERRDDDLARLALALIAAGEGQGS